MSVSWYTTIKSASKIFDTILYTKARYVSLSVHYTVVVVQKATGAFYLPKKRSNVYRPSCHTHVVVRPYPSQRSQYIRNKTLGTSTNRYECTTATVATPLFAVSIHQPPHQSGRWWRWSKQRICNFRTGKKKQKQLHCQPCGRGGGVCECQKLDPVSERHTFCYSRNCWRGGVCLYVPNKIFNRFLHVSSVPGGPMLNQLFKMKPAWR